MMGWVGIEVRVMNYTHITSILDTASLHRAACINLMTFTHFLDEVGNMLNDKH
jgi:hypothetical protein